MLELKSRHLTWGGPNWIDDRPAVPYRYDNFKGLLKGFIFAHNGL